MADTPGAPPVPPPSPSAPMRPGMLPPVHPPFPRREQVEFVTGGPEAQAASVADALVRGGMSIDRVRAVMTEDGYPDWTPSGGHTAAQVEHDRQHGVSDAPDPNNYSVTPPAELGLDRAEGMQFTQAMQNFAADIGFDPTIGSHFLAELASATAQLDNAEDRNALLNKWQADTFSVFTVDQVNAKADQILPMLTELCDPATVETIKSSGLLRNPRLFAYLANRAASFKLWSSTRPK